jgi:hypothetical protein
VIAATQLRSGNASSARGAASLIVEAVTTTRAVLAARPPQAVGEIVVRADSAFYSRKVIAACGRAGVRFSVTVRMDAKIRRAIDAIPHEAWIEIEYPQPVWDEEQQRFVSRAHIAETTYTAFEDTDDAVTARLIARRIPDLNKPGSTTRASCSPSGVTTPPSQTARSSWSRPRPSTAPTPSWSRSSRNSSTDRWLTCRRAGSPRTTPG